MAKTLARKKSAAAKKGGSKSAPKRSSAKPSNAKAGKYVYLFGRKTDGNGTMKPLLGGKGANLAEMCRIGLPVPPGFTISTEVCTYYYANKRTYPPTLRGQMEAGVASLEQQVDGVPRDRRAKARRGANDLELVHVAFGARVGAGV